jgi:hypothetical protein
VYVNIIVNVRKKQRKKMPLNKKGKKIMKAMKKEYGKNEGKKVFYASKNKGVIKGVEKKKRTKKV